MSYAANIARWNAIPMTRESPKSVAGTKRSRSRSASPVVKLQGEYDSSDEDDVSLVSRSPSPNSNKMDITTYDEHHPALEKEVITVETKIKSTNKGYSILAKLGWMDGQSLGLSGDGRVDPIPFSVKNDLTGLGKRAQDERMIETTVSQRRGLDSERQIKETIEQRQSRQQKVAEKEALANQIASTLKPFYCALCDKQYQTVAQYDEHTNSYAHHHKQRFKDMQANAKGLGGGKQDKEARVAKERKREEKELKRMAKARGVKVGTIGGVVGTNALVSGGSPTTEEPKSFKKSGWATVSSTQVQDVGDFSRKSGWATVSSGTTPGATPGSSCMEASPQRRVNHGFRTAGFETLETTSMTTVSKIDGGIHVASGSSDMGNLPSQSKSRWLNSSTAPSRSSATPSPPAISPPPPPPPAAIPPPPPPSPPSALPPPPPPPSWPLQPSSRCPPSRESRFRNDRVSSSFREPFPGRYMPGERPPSPQSYHRPPVPPPPHRGQDRYNEHDREECQSRLTYRGPRGY